MDDNSTIQKAKKIVKEKNLSFPVIEDQENTLGDKFLVKTLPYSLFFESGKLVKIFSDSDKFTEEIISEYRD